jgi:hypothetical protein
MSWLIVAIVSYFILAVVSLVDKYLLTSSIPNPKSYTFYVGILGIFVLVFIPFVGFYIPQLSQIILALSAGAIFVYALFWFYNALFHFEASRVIPAISGLVPLFTFFLVYISSSGKEVLPAFGVIAFILLVLGSVLMAMEREKFINKKSLKISIICAFLLSLSFTISKYVYLNQSFWNGFIWIKLGGVIMGFFFFLFTKDIREKFLKIKNNFGKEKISSMVAQKNFKTPIIFLSNQTAGAGANILQNWAIALAPLIYIAVINALQGVQYVFLLILTVLISLKFPKILKEEISRKILIQKIFAILLIVGGLAILALKQIK